MSKAVFLLYMLQNIILRNNFRLPGFEPTPVEYRPSILPLSQATLLFANFKLILLRTQHPPGPRRSVFFSKQKKRFFLNAQKMVYNDIQITW